MGALECHAPGVKTVIVHPFHFLKRGICFAEPLRNDDLYLEWSRLISLALGMAPEIDFFSSFRQITVKVLPRDCACTFAPFQIHFCFSPPL